MTNQVAAVLIIGILGIALAYKLGRGSAARQERANRRRICQDYYQEALNHHGESRMVEALVAAGTASGHAQRHECYNVIGQVFDDMGHFESASRYWFEARTAARSQAVHRQIYYYYREARSLLKSGNYEFAYLRSRAAVEAIDSGHLPKGSGDIEHYEHLRALRMISSLNHLKGTAGWAAAKIDAQWLQTNATAPIVKDFGGSIVDADSARLIIESMTERLFAGGRADGIS